MILCMLYHFCHDDVVLLFSLWSLIQTTCLTTARHFGRTFCIQNSWIKTSSITSIKKFSRSHLCPGKSSKPNTLDNPEKNKEKTRSKKLYQEIFHSALTLNQQVPFPITWSIPRSHIRTPSCLSPLQSAPLYLLPTAARPLLRLCLWPHCSPASASLCPGLC